MQVTRGNVTAESGEAGELSCCIEMSDCKTNQHNSGKRNQREPYPKETP